MNCAVADCEIFLKGAEVPDGATARCVEHFRELAETFVPPVSIGNLLADSDAYLIEGGQRVYWRES